MVTLKPVLDHVDNKSQVFTARDFRDALSTFATGVTIVTAQDQQGHPVGMTASSFNSVSMDPPLILWSVTKAALSAPAFTAAKNFAIHILATDQTELSNRFSKSGVDKFSETDFHLDENEVPVLAGCAARLDCTTWAIHEGGDHWIIIGHVDAIESAKKEGLVFGGGSYATAAPLTTIDNKPVNDVGSDSLIDNMLFYHLSRAYHQFAHQFHEVVRESGMTVAEWRVSASLYGKSTCSFQELMERTFLDATSLPDIITRMVEDGFCTVSEKDGARYATGTAKGHERVKHLFDLAQEQEAAALAGLEGDDGDNLKDALRRLVASLR